MMLGKSETLKRVVHTTHFILASRRVKIKGAKVGQSMALVEVGEIGGSVDRKTTRFGGSQKLKVGECREDGLIGRTTTHCGAELLRVQLGSSLNKATIQHASGIPCPRGLQRRPNSVLLVGRCLEKGGTHQKGRRLRFLNGHCIGSLGF